MQNIEYAINYYYHTDQWPTPNAEDSLGFLCDVCAQRRSDTIQWASQGDEDIKCEDCGRFQLVVDSRANDEPDYGAMESEQNFEDALYGFTD